MSKRNKSPFCSHCSTQKCKHYKQYVEVKNQQRNANLNASNNTNNSVETNSDDENPPSALPGHYDDIEPLDEYTKNYGYNLSRIIYPYKLDPATQNTWLRRLDGHYDLPDRIITVH